MDLSDYLGIYTTETYSRYFLRTPSCFKTYSDFYHGDYYCSSYVITAEHYDNQYPYHISHVNAIAATGIRPAFYLDSSVAYIESGDGSEVNPYILTDEPKNKLNINVMDRATDEPVPCDGDAWG